MKHIFVVDDEKNIRDVLQKYIENEGDKVTLFSDGRNVYEETQRLKPDLHSLNVIISESQRLKKIVESITYLAKLENVSESFQFKLRALDDVLREAVKSVGAIAEQRGIDIHLENRIADHVSMDEEKLKRAFINLLGNALRYAESKIEVKGYKDKDSLIIEIIDDGIGFAPGEETKVFERFYSGDSSGTGIGLAITKAIVEGHNGTVTSRQNEPKGAVFQVGLKC